MAFLIFIQMVFNVALSFFVLALLKKQNADRKDERLSQALRLLEKKISLLQELSRQIDHQVFSTANAYKMGRSKIEKAKKQTQTFKDSCDQFKNKNSKDNWPSKVYDFKNHVSLKAKSFAYDLKNVASKEPPLTLKDKLQTKKDKPQTNLKLISKDDSPEDSL